MFPSFYLFGYYSFIIYLFLLFVRLGRVIRFWYHLDLVGYQVPDSFNWYQKGYTLFRLNRSTVVSFLFPLCVFLSNLKLLLAKEELFIDFLYWLACVMPIRGLKCILIWDCMMMMMMIMFSPWLKMVKMSFPNP